jgi:hypothetical protein
MYSEPPPTKNGAGEIRKNRFRTGFRLYPSETYFSVLIPLPIAAGEWEGEKGVGT